MLRLAIIGKREHIICLHINLSKLKIDIYIPKGEEYSSGLDKLMMSEPADAGNLASAKRVIRFCRRMSLVFASINHDFVPTK